MRQYLRLVNEHVTDAHKLKTKAITGSIMIVMGITAVWYNLIIQYYYIVYMDA